MPTATVPTLEKLLEPPPTTGRVAELAEVAARLNAVKLEVVKRHRAATEAVNRSPRTILEVALAGGDIEAAIAEVGKIAAELGRLSIEERAVTEASVRLQRMRHDAQRTDSDWLAWSEENALTAREYREATRPKFDWSALNPRDKTSPNHDERARYQRLQKQLNEAYDELVESNLAALDGSIKHRRAKRGRSSTDAGFLGRRRRS